MLALVFSYDARDPDTFERVYGPEGEWAEFFRRGQGYVGTELLVVVEGGLVDPPHVLVAVLVYEGPVGLLRLPAVDDEVAPGHLEVA